MNLDAEPGESFAEEIKALDPGGTSSWQRPVHQTAPTVARLRRGRRQTRARAYETLVPALAGDRDQPTPSTSGSLYRSLLKCLRPGGSPEHVRGLMRSGPAARGPSRLRRVSPAEAKKTRRRQEADDVCDTKAYSGLAAG